MDRRIFNHPIRKETTEAMFPDKLTLEEFKSEIIDNFDEYARNMVNIKANKPKYIEEWVEQYLAWLEIEEER